MLRTLLLARRYCRKNFVHQENFVHPNDVFIPGLTIIRNYLTEEDCAEVHKELQQALPDNIPYDKEYNRRITNILQNELQVKIPKAFEKIQKTVQDDLFPKEITTVQICDYKENGGCSKHIDASSIGDIFAIFSFGGECVMHLEEDETQIPASQRTPTLADNPEREIPKLVKKADLYLEPGSLVIFGGPARKRFYHQIEPSKEHHFGGEKIERKARHSLIFWAEPPVRDIPTTRPEISQYLQRIVVNSSAPKHPGSKIEANNALFEEIQELAKKYTNS